MRYKRGDKVYCRINKDQTVIFDVEVAHPMYQNISFSPFLVIGTAEEYSSYIIKVPLTLEDSICWFVMEKHLAKYQIRSKYLGKLAMLIKESSIDGVAFKDPYDTFTSCLVCKEFSPYIDEEVDGFVCFVCRTDPRNFYKLP